MKLGKAFWYELIKEYGDVKKIPIEVVKKKYEEIAEQLSRINGNKVSIDDAIFDVILDDLKRGKLPRCLCARYDVPEAICPCPMVKLYIKVYGYCWCHVFYEET